jgi:hypothetical protein
MASIKIPVETKITMKTKLSSTGNFKQYGGVRMKVEGYLDSDGYLNLTIDIEDNLYKKEETLLKLIEDAKRN